MRTLLATVVVAASLLLPVLATPALEIERAAQAESAAVTVRATGPTYLNGSRRNHIARRAAPVVHAATPRPNCPATAETASTTRRS